MPIFLATLIVLLSIWYTEPGPVYGESSSIPEDTGYQLKDYRINKTTIGGKYVCADDPDFYFEVYDDFAVLSDALYKSQGLSGDYIDSWVVMLSFKALTWLSFTTSYSKPTAGGYTDWKTFTVYTSDIADPEAFYVENEGVYSLPWERQVYKKVNGDSSENTLEDRLTLDASAIGSVQEISITAGRVFPKMGSRIYKLEIEKVIGDEVVGYRNDNGIPYAGFLYNGYRFEYKLSGDSYDIFSDTVLCIHAID